MEMSAGKELDSNSKEYTGVPGEKRLRKEKIPKKLPDVVAEYPICEGDTEVIQDVLNDADHVLERINNEVKWQTMTHRGGEVPRLVAIQGIVDKDGSMPCYRHPAEAVPPLLPFSPFVDQIRIEIEKRIGHTVNHVLIQKYRKGPDYISDHSDKTLDINADTFIVNVSLGAQRTMILRLKKGELNGNGEPNIIRTALPHNSMLKMGLSTNRRWTHEIRQDKRMDSEKTVEELAYAGERISLTFRSIGTFVDKEEVLIWGNGATQKEKKNAQPVINGNDTPEAQEMIEAFGLENRRADFSWSQHYGLGFDVLLTTGKESECKETADILE